MKYLKDFSSESDYLDYRYGNEFTNPNVSLCNDKGNVYYNFTPPPITYDYVDFGLPSGTKWATKNVGARKPSDAGFYFQWGDTKGYTANQVGKNKQFNWNDYKFTKNELPLSFSKYTTSGATLELEDDAAHVNMGGDWHMPTPEQMQELLNNTTSIYKTLDGVKGRLFISNIDTSKSIFIPVTGGAYNGSVVYNDAGGFWLPTIDNYTVYGQAFIFGEDAPPQIYNYFYRCDGAPIRGVMNG